MDKETLSNYGWIVVLVLILAVMMALATPFGSFVSTAIKDVTGGFWDVNSASLNAVGLDTGDIGFDGDPASCGIEGHYIGDDKGEHGIPVEDCASGHTYTCECDGWIVPNDGTYTMKSGATYTAGQELPCGYNAVSGDVYVDKYYTYSCLGSCWRVRVLDKTKTSYGEIYESIANKPIEMMDNTFKDCESLIVSPVIPSRVTDMSHTFENCTSLTTAPIIPSRVTQMYQTFYKCTSLKISPAIPNRVSNMYCAFGNCTSLTTPPNMSNATNVSNMHQTFVNCTSLTTCPNISNSNKITNMQGTFQGCTSLTTPPPEIPSRVTNMYQTFSSCTSLTTPPDMSKATSVTDMRMTFYKCISLKATPVIPNSVTKMSSTFENCTSLTGTIEINANPTSYSSCFSGVKFISQGITLTGSSTMLDTLKATGSNS